MGDILNVSAGLRVGVVAAAGLLAGVIAALLSRTTATGDLAPMIGWDVAAVAFLVWTWAAAQLALQHMLISYVFGAVILAAAIQVVSGLAK